LIEGLPVVDCPLQWLQNAMNCDALPMRLRLRCAVALLAYVG